MGFIYKITNTNNNKVYIGQTTKTIEERWQEHVRESRKMHRQHRPLYDAINKYGVSSFKIECLEEVSDSSLSDREVFYIQQYRSYVGFDDCNGYNATLGGDFKTTIEWTSDEIEFLIKEYNLGRSCIYIAQKLGYCQDTIIDKLKSLGFQIRIGGRKVICQLSMSGELINIYASATEAATALGSTSKNLHIGEVCQGKRASGGGYRWMYYDDYIKQIEE